MKIGVISDTHGLLRPEVTERLRDCDAILHAGDIGSRKILERLEEIAPVSAVRGNCDGDWARKLPKNLKLSTAGLRICMAHKKKDLPADLTSFDLAVYGHTHRYASEWTETADGNEDMKKTLLLNPGSCGPGRFLQPVTMAVVTVRGDGWTAERVDIRDPAGGQAAGNCGDLRRQIEIVIRETQRGRTVEDISDKTGIDRALTEQIARLYLTHPGVTVDGIMTKMGL